MGDTVTTNQLMVVLEAMRSEIKVIHECFGIHTQQLEDLRTDLKEDIALVDAKVMGLAQRVDDVEERLSREITGVRAEVVEVRADLAEHRENSEMHHVAKRRALKNAA